LKSLRKSTNLTHRGLIRELLPPGVQIVKGPAIYRETKKKVTVTVSQTGNDTLVAGVSTEFNAISGWELEIYQ